MLNAYCLPASVNPIQRSADGFLPRSKQLGAATLGHLRRPAFVDLPIAEKILTATPVTHSESGRIGSPQRRGLRDFWPHHGNVDYVRLELHEQFITDHSAVDAQFGDWNRRVLLHRGEHFPRLIGSGLECRARN